MRRDKPSVEDIKKLVTKLTDDIYGDVRTEFDKDEKFYELDFLSELGLPEEFKNDGTVLPTGRDMVDTAVDHTDISNARVLVNKKGITDIAADEAEMMRKFYLGMIYRTNVESSISPWRIAAKHYWLHGVTFIKTVWDADRWPDKPIRRTGEGDEGYDGRIKEWRGTTELDVPIIIQAINPVNVLPDPDHIEVEYIIEHHKRACFSIRKRYPAWKNPEGREIDEDVDWVEYWDDTYKCFLADGVPVLKIRGGVVKHNYGFLPYVQIDSGLGNLSHEGNRTMRWVGLMRYMRSVLIAESRNYSVSDIILRSGAFPWGYLTGENAANVKSIDRYFGRYQALPEGVKIETMSPDVPPDALRVQQAITSDIIASHSAPRSVRGMSEQGVRSGADRRLMIAEAGMRYAYSKDAFKYGTAKVLINCAKLFKNVIPGNVRLWARTDTDDFDEVIDKKKMKEPFTCYVEFAPISDEDEYRRHDDLLRNVQGGIITPRWARSQWPNIDPVAMDREIEKDVIKQSPALRKIQEQYIQAKAQEAFNVRLGAEGAPGYTSPAVGGGGQDISGRMTTSVPNVAPLGSPQDMQNKLRQQRSQVPAKPFQGQGGGGRRYA